MKSKIIGIVLACIGTSLARADFTPIPLDPTSFNQDPVVAKTAPPSINDYVTASMDQGTNKNGNAFYEIGYVTTNTTGLPLHGTSMTHSNNSTGNTYTFQMAPDYHTNNCLFIGHHNSNWTPIWLTATFTLTTPAPFKALSILNGSPNGPDQVQATVHFAGGGTEVYTFSSTDWFSGNADATITRVFSAHGLIGMQGGVNNQNAANPGTLFANDLTLSDQTDNVTSIDFAWLAGNSNGNSPWGNGRTGIFAVAGSTDGVIFNPVAVTGYNADVIVEADAPKTWGCGPESITGVLTNNNAYCSFTMDGGTNRYNWTWYEKGYYASYPQTGLPAAGSTITSATKPSIKYTMPATYTTNCAVCLYSNGTTAQIKFATPTSASALSFLAGGGNGGLTLRVELGFQGGGSETNIIIVPDWFDRTDPWAYVTFGQVMPGARSLRNTPDQYANWTLLPNLIGIGPQPFSRDPRNGGASFQNLPLVRLFDCVMPVSNSGGAISTINLVCTNVGLFGNTVSILAVSGSPGMPPVITTQPFSVVTDNLGTPIVTNAAAQANNIIYTKGYQGTNNIFLITSNFLSSGVSYQWKKAPLGGGWRDVFLTYDMSTFANVTAPNVGGVNSSTLAISNATLADSGDYILLCSNQYGMQTSFVATVMVLSTNYSLLVGKANGDTITHTTSDQDSGGSETVVSVIDQVLQKWLSWGLLGVGINGQPVTAVNQLPYVGPVGYIVTPAAGASFVNNIRFYCANDTAGGDPRDYTLEGSNDGTTWTTINNGQLLGTRMLPAGRNGGGSIPLNPMTQNLMEVDFANSTSYKSYRFWITNCIEPVATGRMQISEIQFLGSFVPAPPTWVLQPVPAVTAFVGTSPTLTASATGQGALAPHYQWFLGSTPIAGATGSSYTITNIQTASSGASFSVTAQNTFGIISSTTALITVVAAPTQSYPSAVLADTPTSYWRLDERPDNGAGNNGVLAHDYTGGHNGTYSNNVLVLQGYSAFDPDTAAGFGPGVDSFVGNIAGVDFARASGNAAFSIEAWVFGATPTGTGAAANPAIIAKGDNGNLNPPTQTGSEQYALDLTTTGFRFLVRGPNGQGYVAQSSVLASDPVTGAAEWHHLIGVCDEANGNLLLYVDGLLAATGTIPANTGILTQPLPTTIGSRKSTSAAADYDNQWPGTIDEVAVYSKVLTPNQALAHFLASQTPPVIQGPAYLVISGGTNWIAANNVPVTFPANAYGPGTLSYQWWHSDNLNPTTPIPGATSSNYTFTTTPAMDNTFFQLVVTNQYGAVTSAIVNLSVHVGAPDFIVDLPPSDNIFLGHIIQLHVNPGGTGPFTYQWQKNSVNILNDYRTSGVQSDTLTIGYANTNDSGGYQVIVTGSAGSAPSTMDAVSVLTNSSAFFGADSSPSSWNLQGTTAPILYPTNAIQMTGGLGGTGRSAWLSTKKDITSFNATFIYQLVGGTGGQADGLVFCIQNESATEFTGGTGGSQSYDGITPSVALELQIYNGNPVGIAFCQNGVRPAAVSIAPNVNVGQNANPISVNMIYNGSVLQFTLKDTVTGLSVITNWTVNIPGVLGANTGWIGFTAADGGVTSTQIASWPAGGAVIQPTPIRMTAQKVGNNIVLSWPAKNGGYLESSPTVGPTAAWTYSTAPWQLIGDKQTGTQQATVPIGSGSAYLRLQQLAP